MIELVNSRWMRVAMAMAALTTGCAAGEAGGDEIDMDQAEAVEVEEISQALYGDGVPRSCGGSWGGGGSWDGSWGGGSLGGGPWSDGRWGSRPWSSNNCGNNWGNSWGNNWGSSFNPKPWSSSCGKPWSPWSNGNSWNGFGSGCNNRW